MRAFLFLLTTAAFGCSSIWAADESGKRDLPPSKLTPLAKPDTVERLRPLYSLSIDSAPAGGRETKLKIEELKRNERTSLVAYDYVSGSAVGTSMTVVFALYRIALDRGAKFFVTLQSGENRKPTEYLVGFSDEKVDDPAKHFGVTGSLDEKLKWWSVEELEATFSQVK